MQDYTLVVLAAGKGTRMKSKKQKVLHEIAGKSILKHLIDSLSPLPVKKMIMVIGHQKDIIKAELKGRGITFIEQVDQLGTGHALLQAKKAAVPAAGNLLVLYSDTPLIRTEILENFLKFHGKNENKISLLTTEFDNPTGYGRVVRDGAESVERIVEEDDANKREKEITEVNPGFYCFTNDENLWSFLKSLKGDNEQGEFYLTDLISIYRSRGFKVGCMKIDDGTSLKGVNTRKDLAEAERVFRERKIDELLDSGVTITDPRVTYIDQGAQIGMDTIILPFTHIKGDTKIGQDCLIGPHSFIVNSEVESGVMVRYSVIEQSRIRTRCQVGPFSHLRPGADIGPEVSIGNYVEVKKSRIKEGTKVNHLTYIGDSQIGKKVNVGAGSITCNYDGKRKHKTYIGEGSFIGSNTSLVAPIKIGKNTVVGAGSTLTKDVPDKALAVARKRQVNIKNWTRRGDA